MGATLNTVQKKQKTHLAEIVRHGEKLILPEGMKLPDAVKVLQRRLVEEEMVMAFDQVFDTFIWDGCYALMQALDKRYGWFEQAATPGFFGDTPPALIGVEIEAGKSIQVPWGRFHIPPVPKTDGYLSTSYARKDDKFVFRLSGQMKKKYADEFHALCDLIRQTLQTSSLYKGKAVSIKFRDKDGEPLPMPEPKFLKLQPIPDESMVFSKSVEASIQANLFAPIEYTKQAKELGIPLKRGALLAGDYGVGKTLVAFATAGKAVANGWTFIYCQQASEFPDVVQFAQQYSPAVVFCEDIDRVVQGERTEEVDKILNVVDGIDSKKTEVMVVLTTNNVEKIQQAMLRPGRLDAVIHVEKPDAEAVTRLVKLYAGELIPEGEDLRDVGKLLSGQIPAVIRECVERSKLAALSIAKGDLVGLMITAKALIISAETMKMQLDLLQEKRFVEPSDIEKFGRLVGAALKAGLQEAFGTPTTLNAYLTEHADSQEMLRIREAAAGD